ncbi:hypothetical protein [Isoptericola aurantiacus]|uniref:hypothetical protein n=1 Tax=Isoptericola aurantiacus TaxID=3377839 RepID=UPI00383A3AF9
MSEYRIKPVSHSVPRAALVVGIGETKIREAIANGDLATHYIGTRPVVLHNELVEWVTSLPDERL